MKDKGFTLVELLITVVVLGIIMGLAFPVIRQTQLQNEKKKYETYAEGMMTSARLYVDSYDEDLFGHHDTGCAYVTYQQLLERDLIKDVPIANRSCNSGQTFVRVVKLKDQYGYSYSLGCGDKENDKAKDVNLLLPEEGVHEMDTSVCRGREGSNIKVSIAHKDEIFRRIKSKVKLESPTGIHGNVVIFATWVKGEERPNDSSEWSRVNFEIPGKQEETILGGDIITVESEDVVSPAGDGNYYLWIRVDELKDMFGEEWKNPNEEEGNYVKQGPFHLDNTAPVCTYSGEVEENAWSKGTRTITIGCQDKGEGASGCKEGKSEKIFTFNETISKGTASYTIYDNAGNSRKCERNDIRLYLDNKAPTCTNSGDSTTWTTGSRTITWGCRDDESGCAPGYLGGNKVFNTTTQTAVIPAYEVRDKVGNSKTCPARTANVYVRKQFTVTLNNQGATSAGSTSVTATYGVAMPAITIPRKNAFTITYNYGCIGGSTSATSTYAFQGYYTGTNGTGVQYYDAAGRSVRNYDKTSAITLYAKWGSITAVTLTSLNNANLTLEGWYTTPNSGTKVGNAGSSYTPTGNVTLYAHWRQNSCSSSKTFNYRGSAENWSVPCTGRYQFTLKGASGGKDVTVSAGKGATLIGNVYLCANQSVTITVGGEGATSQEYGSCSRNTCAGGYNGGGSGYWSGGGGGRTDLKLNGSLIAAAAGGGGATNYDYGRGDIGKGLPGRISTAPKTFVYTASSGYAQNFTKAQFDAWRNNNESGTDPNCRSDAGGGGAGYQYAGAHGNENCHYLLSPQGNYEGFGGSGGINGYNSNYFTLVSEAAGNNTGNGSATAQFIG